MKLSETIMIIIKLNKRETRSQAQVEQMRDKNKSPAQVRICFEERVVDKKESIELYETICNNNENIVEQMIDKK